MVDRENHVARDRFGGSRCQEPVHTRFVSVHKSGGGQFAYALVVSNHSANISFIRTQSKEEDFDELFYARVEVHVGQVHFRHCGK
jgi:hypothetical protein